MIDGLRQRVIQSRRLLFVAVSCVAFVILLAFSALTIQTGAAHSATRSDAVTLTFTVAIVGGTPPNNVVFWVCPDAQVDGTGCAKMSAGASGTYTYQLATTTGTTYQHLTIEWSRGQKTGGSGPIPVAPAYISCDYANFAVTDSGPHSFTCQANFSAPTVTPVPSVTTTAAPADTPTPASSAGDNGTLITGLQIIIGVGLVLFILLLIILIWQRASGPKKP
ncbi:MAG TPA: hypothetical protein VKT82_26935 [Ktedonobacterales bacterium]|nr:hypothetical protein [Ktedonobacterales bacterium]